MAGFSERDQIPRSGERSAFLGAVASVEERQMAAEMSSTESVSEPARAAGGLSLTAWLFLVLIGAAAVYFTWLSVGDIDPVPPKTWAARSIRIQRFRKRSWAQQKFSTGRPRTSIGQNADVV